ncbi:nascent polypeptide-associated complex beta subunit [Perkinsus olseni]|uniref:Nascent polypeptide-associated complex subunit beta n=1 Tax=Perkinsus olseni TaxID=32597 RepID=A0A7J6T0M0_PEROL|nr:nascent polypeptide-associated complex beta subunit [Perkinsus olseni]KAF4665665.1 nascent polypeptide-associated complex beta subunit [Perkinsus olseni]KAF4737110.1 nascent polypeptide-associated complex beta subunit [Perkinsus olseni]KAF4738784.1 nascent polypeptide-associated complex beta subunit [Perkinsus olseni]
METDPKILEARAQLRAKLGDGAQRAGGRGSARLNRKAVHRGSSAASDDKKLFGMLKRLGCHEIPGIDEVNMFKADSNIIHFERPKFQAAIGANTFVVSGGNAAEKTVDELMPEIIPQLGPENVAMLKEIANQMRLAQEAQQKGKEQQAKDDEEVPELEGDFEEASKKEEKN